MKIIFRLCFLALLSIYFPTLLIAQKSDTHIPDYPIRKGVSAPFAGFTGSTLIVAGGCNFPDKPAAEGGKKVYYAQVYSLTPGTSSTQWQEQTPLPIPVAYGASVETEEGTLPRLLYSESKYHTPILKPSSSVISPLFLSV